MHFMPLGAAFTPPDVAARNRSHKILRLGESCA